MYTLLDYNHTPNFFHFDFSKMMPGSPTNMLNNPVIGGRPSSNQINWNSPDFRKPSFANGGFVIYPNKTNTNQIKFGLCKSYAEPVNWVLIRFLHDFNWLRNLIRTSY
ncbi:hypothetical protein AADEFJLK_04701 [Methylovulum psychrotolerans]|uniref:Uncharacterized protein n=1 Tax=Methylovulum psychrotolerans TaxID=1704499 RepID=A0A2S5CFF1_9GAMM|nr:hypothetical protein AADEFJLK_04701 [Methylovulum psychrotolerans]